MADERQGLPWASLKTAVPKFDGGIVVVTLTKVKSLQTKHTMRSQLKTIKKGTEGHIAMLNACACS